MPKRPVFDAIRRLFSGSASPSGREASQPHSVKTPGRDVVAFLPRAHGRRADEKEVWRFLDTIPAMIWIVDANGRCVFVNRVWLAFAGRRLDQELEDGWAESIHPEFREQALTAVREASAGRHSFRLEFRLKCGEGEYRWLRLNGTPQYDENGEFTGMIGAGTDITGNLSKEAELLDLSGRLIKAHEEERSRIARELHDDLSQQMALLSTDLDQLAQQAARSSPEISRGFGKAQRRAQSVFSELHRLSYEIHPSKLDRLGLAAASLSLCREVSKQQNLRLEFSFKDVPEPLPRDISLCLYRVIQESVRNIVKHSGAVQAEVELTGSPSEIRLRILDAGVGFNPDRVGEKGGLGLLSMRERLRLVRGTMVIESQPLRGTRITATVPLPVAGPASTREADPQRTPA
jgi:PAS domain S-box-containing protein